MSITANPLPKPIGHAAVVTYDDSFFIVGGEKKSGGGPNVYGDLYKYNAENDEWIEMESKLKTPRSRHIALLVQQSVFPKCS